VQLTNHPETRGEIYEKAFRDLGSGFVEILSYRFGRTCP
jgi:hypothetical protein